MDACLPKSSEILSWERERRRIYLPEYPCSVTSCPITTIDMFAVAGPSEEKFLQAVDPVFEDSQPVDQLNHRIRSSAWYYDFGNGKARFDHLHGQKDNFCNAGLKLKDSRGDCHLLFNTTDMYVHYPREQQCCRACGAAEGCGILKPTWLAGAKYLGKETISGMVCLGWEAQGTVAVDRWYQTEDGRPCRYWERIIYRPHPVHSITFNISTYSLDPIPTSVFDVPEYCSSACPSAWTTDVKPEY